MSLKWTWFKDQQFLTSNFLRLFIYRIAIFYSVFFYFSCPPYHKLLHDALTTAIHYEIILFLQITRPQIA